MTRPRPPDTARGLLELLGIAALILLAYGWLHPAHAATDTSGASPPAVPTWSLGEVMALIALIIASIGAVVDAARAVLHFTAPRTTSTVDDRAAAALDALHDRISALEGMMMRPAVTGAPAAGKSTTAVPVTMGVAPLLVVLFFGALAVGGVACGSTHSSRAATISSIDTGIITARGALRTYERDHADAIIAATPDKPARAVPLAELRAKVDKVTSALDAATLALDSARAANDDPSIKGAQAALDSALAGVAALTGGAP